MSPDLPECRFETERLKVSPWHSAGIEEHDLPRVVCRLLTPSVTRNLPPGWQGEFTPARAKLWIAERDAESSVLVAMDRTSAPVGLVICSAGSVRRGIELRIGYLISETSWGFGLGSELVAGLVHWCRKQPEVHSMVAGAAKGNQASIRVLEKNGFVTDTESEHPPTEELFRIDLR